MADETAIALVHTMVRPCQMGGHANNGRKHMAADQVSGWEKSASGAPKPERLMRPTEQSETKRPCHQPSRPLQPGQQQDAQKRSIPDQRILRMGFLGGHSPLGLIRDQ